MTTTTLSPEVLAMLELAMSTKVESTAVMGINFGLIEYALANRIGKNGKPKVVTSLRGDYFTSNCPLLTASGKASTIEEANSWLGVMAEYSEAEGSVLDVSVTLDYKTLTGIAKIMQKEGMTYATLSLSKVAGIHKRIAKNKDGQTITALAIDMFDRENIEVKAAGNPMAMGASYCNDDDVWFQATSVSAQAKRGGMDKWKAAQNAVGEKTSVDSESSLDDLEEEEVATVA
jgi:hypothetical protein